jgi:hypothetical protein
MPVEKVPNSKSKLARRLVCDRCSVRSAIYVGDSPAAPDLTACERAEVDGWAYDIGFFSMLVGHTVLCPACKKG